VWQQRQNLFLAVLLACGWDAWELDLAVEVTVSLFLFFWLFPPDLGFPDCQDWGRRKVIVSCMILLSHLALMALMPSRSLWKVGSISKPSWNTLMMNLTTLIGSSSVVAEETLCLRTQACTCCRMWSRFAAEFVAWPKRDKSCKCHHSGVATHSPSVTGRLVIFLCEGLDVVSHHDVAQKGIS